MARTLNLGILAHVDAGKTSLTERLLYAAGVIDALGSVDDGNTQTDTLALEQRRGITIKSAVVSFVIDDVTVNLIDTPGHPDFIAEVERVLNVLDGAVLVVSAVEGVQAQTRVLMRTLQRLRIPTLVFVNKIDRAGADDARVLRAISEKLTDAIVPMGVAGGLGTRRPAFTAFGAGDLAFRTRLTELLADHDESILAAFVDDEEAVSYDRLRRGLAAQTGRALVHPVFLGSAITGTGVEALASGIAELLPATGGDAEGPVSGTVFKVERGEAGEKVAYVRMFSGTVRTRDRLRLGVDEERKVTAIRVFDRGRVEQRPAVVSGEIGKVWGLGDVRIGDAIGLPRSGAPAEHFAPPTLETSVVAQREDERGALHLALTQLAEQDPLINLRQDDVRHELFVSLYGEVQKEVIQETLASDYDLDVEFRETTTICIERPAGSGEAVEAIGDASNPFFATVGLRVDPGVLGSGVEYGLDVELGGLPLSFHKAVEETVRGTLDQGLHGWRVTDCVVTMTHSGQVPESTAGDYRGLTPLVLMAALAEAGTTVLEPMHRVRLEVPADTLGAAVALLGRVQAVPDTQEARGSAWLLEGQIPAARVHELQLQLPAVTRGEGVLECEFDEYRPVSGTPPARHRSHRNPLNREEYLLHVARRV